MMRIFTHKTVFVYLFILAVLGFQKVMAEDWTVETLSDMNITLTEAGELHLTSSTAAMSNSTIDIKHEDAWVFFDNVKPSAVMDNYGEFIKINGATLANGTNARVAIYKHGAVVMAHGSAFKPLTVFTEESLQGDSSKMAIHTYYNKLNEFDNAIKSFRLKRGYMATFANEKDGSGYSRVFIADRSDLIVDVLQDELYESVSFIRVFKWNWVTKKGKAGWDPNILNGTCYYDWNVGGNTSLDVEYSVIRQNGGWPSWGAINSKENVSHLLGFNEPDRPDQANMTYNDMLAQWPAFMNSGLRIGSPAWSSAWTQTGDGEGNLFDFVRKCDELNYRLDFVALHCYWGGKSASSWYNDLKYIHEQTGRPLWITEWNNGANWTTEWWPDSDRSYTDANANKQLNDMKAILEVMDTASFIERYFIYDWVEDCRAMVLNNTLTKAGEYYANNNSQEAYNPLKEVVPHWNYYTPTLTYSYSSTSNKVTLEWEDKNGELSKGYKVERKVAEGDFEEIDYVLNDESYSYEDSIAFSVVGGIVYRISAKTNAGQFLESNEVSIYMSSKESLAEFGLFDVKGDDWNYCIFSEKQSTIPQIILGVPSYNNRGLAMTQRVYATTTTNCRFKLFPFNYIDEEISDYEKFPLMAIPAGVYNFNGMEVQAKSATSIKGDWKSFTFAEPFSTTPVVFLTQTSNYNKISLAPKVRNVTTTGFEVKLQAEEAETGYISSEKMSYLAVTPGESQIGSKRVIVGTGEVGDFYSTHEVVFDESFVTPVVFGGVQTSNDDITSTLRYYQSAVNKVKLFKKREVSVTSTKVSKDQVGYMVVDISDNQPGVNSISDDLMSDFSLYPNPTVDILNFDFEEPTEVKVYSMTGQLMIVAVVKKSLDISELNSGNYTVKINGKRPQVITKW